MCIRDRCNGRLSDSKSDSVSCEGDLNKCQDRDREGFWHDTWFYIVMIILFLVLILVIIGLSVKLNNVDTIPDIVDMT